MKNARSTLNSLALLRKHTPTQELLFGAISGYITGYVVMKVSRGMAFISGISTIVFQVAQDHGLTKKTWGDAKNLAKNLEAALNGRGICSKAADFGSRYTCFAASFSGGFLLAVAKKIKK